MITRVEDGLIIDVNEGFERMLGYTPADALGKTTTALDIWANPEDRVRFTDALRHEGRVEGTQVNLRNKAGNEHTCVLAAEIISVGEEPCVVTTVRDITERIRAEEEREELERQLRQAQKMEAIEAV